MIALREPFLDRSSFPAPATYRLLPFRFQRLPDDRYVVTNDVGEFVILAREELVAFQQKRLRSDSSTYRNLKARHFLFDEYSDCALDLLTLKVRTRAAPVANFTALHIFVVTLRCDHSCHYCQVSRQTEDRTSFDMTIEHAKLALAFTFRTPASHVKIEFQGGEPLLNFDVIRFVVEEAEAMAEAYGKVLQFVIATNLAKLTDEMLKFAKEHEVYFSTSLDGPREMHEAHRPLRGGSSYDATLSGVRRVRETLGNDFVSALMTTTPQSLGRVEEIIDEYVYQGFNSIFLRNLSPYGFAIRTNLVRKYDVDDWLDFYKRGLAHVLEWNRRGYELREDFTSILLQKMFAPRGAAYVDLQSPAGIGIAAIVFNYDGAIYASDEGRMLAEMKDESFRLGHLDTSTYEGVFCGETLLQTLAESIPEASPQCADCAYLPFCGADPVFHKATQADHVGHKAFSAFCKKQMGILSHLLMMLEDDPDARRVLMGWI